VLVAEKISTALTVAVAALNPIAVAAEPWVRVRARSPLGNGRGKVKVACPEEKVNEGVPVWSKKASEGGTSSPSTVPTMVASAAKRRGETVPAHRRMA
jgi:hypothetical protein